jgi:hypothetical protein
MPPALDLLAFVAPYDVWRALPGHRWHRFAPGCFDRGLARPIELWFNHQRSSVVWGRRWGPLATTLNGSLEVFTTAAGLCCRARVAYDGALEGCLEYGGVLRVSAGCDEHVVWCGTAGTAIAATLREISLVVGKIPGYAQTWCRLADAQGERELTRLDLAARRRELEGLRAL